MPTLTHALVTADGAHPSRWMLFLHGIFGSGANWRTFAKRIVAARPGWGAALVDLRMHGGSQGLPEPHTLEAAARDLTALDGALPGPIDAIVGHSFGGKVALEAVRQRGGALSQAWVLDSTPASRPDARGSESTEGVLRMLESMERVQPSRDEFVRRVSEHGFGPEIGQWLAMNLRRDESGYAFKLDLRALRLLLEDYFARDLWSVVESPPGRVNVHLVVGGRSNVFDRGDRARADAIAQRSHGRVTVHTLANAGHWVHVDDPDGLYRVMINALPE